MPQLLSTLINGHAYSFASIKLALAIPGAPPLLERFAEVNYTHSLAPGELRGVGPQPLGTTLGEYTASGSIKIYLEDWARLRSGLMSLPTPPGGFMQKSFVMTVSYASFGCVPTTDVLRGCRVTGSEKNWSRSTDALFVNIPLYILQVLEDSAPAVIQPGLPQI